MSNENNFKTFKPETFKPKTISTMPLTASDYFDQGVEHYDNNRFEQAIAHFDRALELEPELYTALHNRALAKFELGRTESALADMEEVIRQAPENAGAYSDRGYIRLQTGDLNAALADLDAAINIDPENVAALTTRGSAYIRLGRIKMALADFERAIAADRENADVYTERAALWDSLGDFQGALEDYSAAIDRNPDNALTYLSRGRLYGKIAGTETLAAADYCRFLTLADARALEDNSREIFDFFDKLPAPFLLRRLLPRMFAGDRFAAFPSSVDRAAELCRPIQLYLDWLNLQEGEQRDPLNYYRLLAIVHFYMGDPEKAYYCAERYGAPADENGELPDLVSAYYLVESAKRFHEPYEELLQQILHALREQREILISRKNPSDLYYAGLIFYANGRLVEAEEFFAAAETYLPASYMYLQALRLMSADAELVESKIAGLRAREAALRPEQAYLPGFPKRYFQTEFSHFFAPFQQYAHYREIENVLATIRPPNQSPDRGELWTSFEWQPEKRAWVEWMIRREALSSLGKFLGEILRKTGKPNLEEHLVQIKADVVQYLEQDNWALTLHETPADFQRAVSLPHNWHTHLSALISHRDFPLIQYQARLVDYFYLRGNLTVWEALLMYYYIVYIKDSGVQDASLADITDLSEKMAEWLFDPLNAAVPATSCAALLHWLKKFRDHSQTAGSIDPDTGGPMEYSPVYNVFTQDFRRYLAFQRESAGQALFDAEYPLKPFFA